MAKFYGIEQTQYGPKAKMTNKNGEVKQYALTPQAMQEAQSLQVGQDIYAKWGDDAAKAQNNGFPIITGFTNEPPKRGAGGGKGNWKPQPYHPETFVSNVVGQAIAAGVITSPDQLEPWCKKSWALIKGMQKSAETPPASPQQPAQPNAYAQASQGTAAAQMPAQTVPTTANPEVDPDFDDDLPF